MWNLNKIFDTVGNYIGRLKTLGILILIILFSMSAIRNGCNRRDAENILEELTGLNLQNDILRNGIIARDSIIITNSNRISKLDDSLLMAKNRYKNLEKKYLDLKNAYSSIADSLMKITADSSYKFLTEVAYPYKGEMKYPFNEPQVKGIHQTYEEKRSLIGMNINLQNQVSELMKQTLIQDTTKYLLTSNIQIMSENRTDLEKIIVNKDEEIQIKDKQLKKEKRKRIFQVTGVAITGGILVVLAMLAG